MKLTCNDVPAHEQSNRIAIASAPVRSAKLTFGSGQSMIDSGRRELDILRAPPVWMSK